MGMSATYFFNIDITYVDNDYYNFSSLKSNDVDGCGNPETDVNLSRRKQRRLHYANFLYRFKKNGLQAVGEIFKSKHSTGNVDEDSFGNFWSDIMMRLLRLWILMITILIRWI